MKPDWLVGIGVNVPLIDTSGRSDKVAAAHSAVSQVQYLKSQAKTRPHCIGPKNLS